MFHPLPLFIGLRYVRTRRRGFFVSFISWVSMLGVCVGVAALIVILSIMNGFEAELRTRLLSFASHATLSASPERMRDWQSLAARLRGMPGVVGAAPYIDLQAMVGRSAKLAGARVRGVLPELETQVAAIDRHMLNGKLGELRPGQNYIVLGAGLAWELQAQVGDELTVLIPNVVTSGGDFDIRSRLQSFIVGGIFELGVQESDNSLALIHLQDAAALLGTDAPGGLRLKFADIFAAPALAARAAAELGGGFTVSDWSKENATYFRAIRIEKTMMALMLMLVVAVAVFNIVAALVMVVNEKRTDIAILRTFGLTPRQVVGVFFTQGLVIGWFGTLLGVLLGLMLAFNVQRIVPFIERLFGMRIFDPTVYYITEIPSEVHWPQVALVAAVALLLTVFSTLYPARRGARVDPADALRYE